MKVKELIILLQGAHPDANVMIADNGSILPTAPPEETSDYNADPDPFPNDFYIVTEEY